MNGCEGEIPIANEIPRRMVDAADAATIAQQSNDFLADAISHHPARLGESAALAKATRTYYPFAWRAMNAFIEGVRMW